MRILFTILAFFGYSYGLAHGITKTIVHNYPENISKSFQISNNNYAPLQISKLIQSAKKNIDIEVFYIDIKKDSVLDKMIIQPLVAKANQGIKVRILVDDKFYSQYSNNKASCDYLNSIKNITCKPTKEFQEAVMHSKMISIDGKSFYIGSHNFDWITFELNHELGVIVKNDKINAAELEKSFNDDWNFTNKSKKLTDNNLNTYSLHDQGNQAIVTVTPDIDKKGYPKSNLKTFISLIKSAKSSIVIQAMIVSGIDPYMNDKNWDEFTKALSDATKRNVYVKIMFSNWMFTKSSYKDSNGWLQKLIHQSNQNHLKIKYTSLPHTKECIPFSEVDHAKYAIFDGTIAWVSTSNIQKSYFYAAKNYSYIADDKDLSQQLTDIFEQLWDSKYAHTYSQPVGIISTPSCT